MRKFGLAVLGVMLAGAAWAQAPVELQGRADKSGLGTPTFAPVLACQSKAIYDTNANGSTELVAAVSGKTVYLCGYTIHGGGTANVKLITGTGTACATDSANLTPAYAITAQTNVVDGAAFYRGLKGALSSAVCINTSAGVAIQAIVYYLQY